MSKLVIAISILSLLATCNLPQTNPDNDGFPKNVTPIDQDDSLMNKAIAKAREEFYVFDSAFRKGNYDKSLFAIKVRFPTKIGGEHIWAHSINLDGETYYGILDDDAVTTDHVKAGDKIKIGIDSLSDWVYSDNGVMKGGFTIKVLRNKMTPKERSAFDSTYYLKIVD